MEKIYDRDKLIGLMEEAKIISAKCFFSDSLHRALAWADLVSAIMSVIEEEVNHDFTFPSPWAPK